MGAGARWTASVVGDFDDHKAAVGRVEWNITGCVHLTVCDGPGARFDGRAGRSFRRQGMTGASGYGR